MMATTHIFVGLSLASVVAVTRPEFALIAAVAAVAGGVVPDLDLYAGHRKTLHFPVYYSVLALPVSIVAPLTSSAETVFLAVFVVTAALHSVMDAFGGGLELKPWNGTSNQAVYSHYHDRWLRPRRWIRYDGAPEDLALAIGLSVPPLLVFDGGVRTVVLVLLAISAAYALVRKPLVYGSEWLLERTPDALVASVPDRFLPLESELVEPKEG